MNLSQLLTTQEHFPVHRIARFPRYTLHQPGNQGHVAQLRSDKRRIAGNLLGERTWDAPRTGRPRQSFVLSGR